MANAGLRQNALKQQCPVLQLATMASRLDHSPSKLNANGNRNRAISRRSPCRRAHPAHPERRTADVPALGDFCGSDVYTVDPEVFPNTCSATGPRRRSTLWQTILRTLSADRSLVLWARERRCACRYRTGRSTSARSHSAGCRSSAAFAAAGRPRGVFHQTVKLAGATADSRRHTRHGGWCSRARSCSGSSFSCSHAALPMQTGCGAPASRPAGFAAFGAGLGPRAPSERTIDPGYRPGRSPARS